MADRTRSSRIPGFYKLGIEARRAVLAEQTGVDPARLEVLDRGGLDLETADHMIENVVGLMALPLGVATNFQIDGVDYLVPMVVEEPSVVAAASNAARMVRAGGGFQVDVSEPVMIGQIQITDIPDPHAAVSAIHDARAEVLARCSAEAPRLAERGGGPVGLEVRVLSLPDDPDGGMIVVHLLVDCRDAMGANLVNSMAEAVADDLATRAGGRVGLRILTNLADERMVHVRCRVPDDALDANGDPARGAVVRAAVVAASRFAELDAYRAATHNKGIMNGVDAVLLATGNDWRGVEAGAHAYAARSGTYRPLAIWRDAPGALLGAIELPMAIGTVGGALHLHAGARLCLDLLAVDSAVELAGVVAATGLASNLAALRALATDGIQRGHMSLHARVVARAAGATGDLIDRVAAEIARLGDVKPERAREILERLRESPLAPALDLEET